jgi:hypothetical protein
MRANARLRSCAQLCSWRGGLLTAVVVDLVGLIISVLGVWDCIEAVEDDVREMNRQHAARSSLIRLEMELTVAEAEFERRHG